MSADTQIIELERKIRERIKLDPNKVLKEIINVVDQASGALNSDDLVTAIERLMVARYLNDHLTLFFLSSSRN